MKMSGLILREKTNVGKKQSITFNSPGNYVAPYGKTTVRIGGKGESGTPGSGGNLASPAVPAYGYGNRLVIATYTNNSPLSPPFPPAGPGEGFTANTYQFSYLDTYTSPTLPSPSSSGGSGPGTYHLDFFYYTLTPVPGTPANYNPYTSGNTGATANIGGVTFPGGIETTAPVVPQTPTTIAYSPSGFTVTVPSGGYITIDNI